MELQIRCYDPLGSHLATSCLRQLVTKALFLTAPGYGAKSEEKRFF